jgi:uncharacterized membrane protein
MSETTPNERLWLFVLGVLFGIGLTLFAIQVVGRWL